MQNEDAAAALAQIHCWLPLSSLVFRIVYLELVDVDSYKRKNSCG